MRNCGAYDGGSKAAIFVPLGIHLKSVAVDGQSK